MSRTSALILTLIAAACSSTEPMSGPIAAPASVAPSVPTERTARTVTLAEGRFGYCGRTIDFPATLESLTDLLGPPSRSEEKANTIDTWDDLGIFAYRKPGESLVFSISVAVSWGSNSFSPTSRFMGKVQLPGGVVTLQSTPDELRAAGLRTSGAGDTFWQRRVGRFSIGATRPDGVREVYLAWRGPDPHHVNGPPLAEGELFTADARAYGFPMDMTLREVSHHGRISVVRVDGTGRNVGPGFFVMGALGEIARRRGYEYFVRSEDRGEAEFRVGFLHDEDADLQREFPDEPDLRGARETFPHDYVFDVLGDWPDGGRPAAAAGAPQPR